MTIETAEKVSKLLREKADCVDSLSKLTGGKDYSVLVGYRCSYVWNIQELKVPYSVNQKIQFIVIEGLKDRIKEIDEKIQSLNC